MNPYLTALSQKEEKKTVRQSQFLFQEAQKVLAGGVNSPVRSFRSVGGTPVFFQKGCGAHLWSEDGKDYIDYVLSWGPLILGHADKEVTDALKKTLESGTSFGAPTRYETELARHIQNFFPSMELMRFVNSGTEACMSAIRLARGFTQRKYILKFNGCYHGHADSLLVAAGSGNLTLSKPDSDGVLSDHTAHTWVLEYNDKEALQSLFHSRGSELAGVIIEPVCGNMGLVLPEKGYLELLRELCTRHGVCLIFDEVMTGFRVALGGAQTLYAITPDITCLGKVIGGGFPCGAYGGRTEMMNCVAPSGGVYQAGTLSGNPMAMSAGIMTLRKLSAPGVFEKIMMKTVYLVEGMRRILRQKKLKWTLSQIGTLFTLFFTEEAPSCLKEVKGSDTEKYARYFHGMLENGVYLPPSPFEACFMSLAHTDDDLNDTLNIFKKVIE